MIKEIEFLKVKCVGFDLVSRGLVCLAVQNLQKLTGLLSLGISTLNHRRFTRLEMTGVFLSSLLEPRRLLKLLKVKVDQTFS